MHVGRLAQLARASRLHREGQGFESLSAHVERTAEMRSFFFVRKFSDIYTLNVYAVCMSRTNIDLPDDDVAELMRRFNLPTKKSAVEFAFKRVLEMTDQRAAVEALYGMGWDGELDDLYQDDSIEVQDDPKISA